MVEQDTERACLSGASRAPAQKYESGSMRL
jgi:hypothetical protein